MKKFKAGMRHHLIISNQRIQIITMNPLDMLFRNVTNLDIKAINRSQTNIIDHCSQT
jgi:hypothetical protein